MADLDERTALYRLYDSHGVLLYVGITSAPERRFAEHAADKHWWPQVADKTVEWYGTRLNAELAEIAAIKNLVPCYNIQHSPEPPTVEVTLKLTVHQARGLDMLSQMLTADLPGVTFPQEELLWCLIDRELTARGLLGNAPCYESVFPWPEGITAPPCAERFPRCRNPACTALSRKGKEST